MSESPTPNPDSEIQNSSTTFPLYVISGGVGASGEQLVRTVLAQFPGAEVSIRIFPKVMHKKQLHQIIQDALEEGAIVVHTFVDPKLRHTAQIYAQKLGVFGVDLVGPLLQHLAEKLHQEPLGKPGLYRQLYKSYFDRIDAIDYTLAHDDGKNPEGWEDAEIVLVGASRVGKTPISLYLSVMGWKVANVPLVADIRPREALFDLDMRRVVGLTLDPSELVGYRQHRQNRLGVRGDTKPAYINPVKVYEETEAIEELLRRRRIPIIDVTDKPIETSADEVIRLVKRRLKLPAE